MIGFTAHGAHQWSKKQLVKPEFEVAKYMVGLLAILSDTVHMYFNSNF